MLERIKRHRLFIAVISFASLVFFWDIFTLQKTFLFGDYKLQFFPWYMEYAKYIKQFSLPFWTPNMGCGFPLVAEGQVGAFYPLNMLIFFFFPPLAAYNYSIILHFILGGIFMYLFMRVMGLEGLAAVIPSILFMFASPYAGCFSNIASLRALCWFPLSLLLIFLSLEKNKPFLLLVNGAIIGLQFLAGAIQMAVYSACFQTVYFLFFLFSDRRNNRASLKYAIFWGASALLAFAIFSPQFLATHGLVSLTPRSNQDLNFAAWNSFFPAGVATLVFPHLVVVLRSVLYIGILPLFFAMAAFFNLKNRNVCFFAAMFLVSLLLSFGRFTPLYPLFLKLSGLYSFRAPSKILFFSAFSLIILSGFGLQWLRDSAKRQLKSIFARSVAIFSLGSIASIISSYLFVRFNKQMLLSMARAYTEKHVYNMPFHRYSLDEYLGRLEGLYQDILNSLDLSNPFIFVSLVIIFAAIALIVLFIRQSLRRDLFLGCSLLLIFFDLLWFAPIGLGFKRNIMPAQNTLRASEITAYLKKDDSLYRVYLYNQKNMQGSELEPNLNMFFAIDNVGIYTPLVFKRYQQLLSELGCVDDSLGLLDTNKEALVNNLALLGLLNVKYIVSRDDLSGLDLKVMQRAGDTRIYLNNKLLPRAFIVYKTKIADSEDKALKFIKDGEFRPGEVVVLEESFSHNLDKTIAGNAYVSIEKYTDREIIIRASSDKDGILVLSDYFYPGWKAYVDNRQTRIYRADYVIRAIFFPQGRHQIRFVYKR